jgi:uncharacterized membrane protein YfcA
MFEPTLIIVLFLMLGVGLLLGMVGGGGSIVVVPIMVYLLRLDASTAIALSLPIVGTTALVGALAKGFKGEVHRTALLLFGGAGALGAILGARLTPLVPEPVLLLIFAALLAGVGWRMWQGRGANELQCDNSCHTGRCLVAGGSVGILTGFLGVGGGFLLVPSLRRFARQTMKLATGTSLGIIAMNSAAGFAGHWSKVSDLLPLLASLTATALIGLFIGLKLARNVPHSVLEKTFAAVALAVACYLLIMNAPGAARLLTNTF